MATTTYEPIATTTLGSAQSSVTFNSFSGYTDLILIVNGRKDAAVTTDAFFCRLNGDGATNYSWTELNGDGSSAISQRITNDSYCRLGVIPGNNAGSTTFGVSIVQFMNYANANTFKTILTRGSVASGQVTAAVSLWRSTAAITSFTLYTAGLGNWASGSTFTLYGIQAAPAWAAKATGGTITNDINYTYHTFTASGTFTPLQNLTCDYLVVAGGGGGGTRRGGGGGAGGYRTSIGGTASALTAQGYTITVGAGGAGSTQSPDRGAKGSNSSISGTGLVTITSTGGGYGTDAVVGYAAGNGGSGGGAGGAASPTSTDSYGGTGNEGGFTPVEGYAGGRSTDANQRVAGGGGGASAVGGDFSGSTSGSGGAGASNSISGTSVTYAGGGGGGAYVGNTAGAGGAGGGGAGSVGGAQPTAGTVNRGGGGGGGGLPSSGADPTGGAGGSGIVIVRYAN